MPVGASISREQLDNILSNLAVNYRNISQLAANLSVEVNGQGQGLAFLEDRGYSSAPNPANPGGISDAAWALQLVDYFSNMSGVWFGTATQAATFNYNNAAAPLWGGQLGT